MADSGNFVHLHNHTHYSLLDGASKIPDLAKRAAELGMPAVGITDHGNMHGAYEMFTNCVANDVKPIIGIEAYVTPETARGDQSRVSWDTDWDPNLDPKHRRRNPDDVSGAGLITHLTLWAENDEGLVSLLKSSSRANLEGRVQRYPRMDKELLSTYSKGVICGSGCPSGIVQTRLALGQFDEALRAAGELQDIFGKDNFFIEIMDHNLHIERRNIKGLLEIAKKLNAPLLATNDSHYVHAEDAEAQDAMLCINSGSHLDDPDRFKFDGSGYYLKPADEMRELFKDFPGACDNTLEIAERCNVIFDDHEDGSFMPQFDCPEGWDETSLFLKKVEQGLEKRYDGNVPAEVAQQADYECGVICQMQFPGYFLVVADYIQWAKDHGIMVGPGRGSAAGSMVAYAMGITELDPLKHGLIFERFLNPERVSLPDIDVDFDPDGRGRVIEYCGEKYGKDKVAQCVIYGVIKTKQALKDSARIMGYDFSMGERVTKALPPSKNGKDASLKEIFNPDSKRYAEAREFRELYDSDPDAHKIIDKAKTIEGLIRQTGVHACATIMGSEPITDTSPLLERTDGTVTTTFEYHTCETLGLVKMDFLGLSNLTVIQDTLKNIVANGKPAIDYTKIPLDDTETYHLLARGDTLGVFQLDSDGMRALLKSLKPDNFNDISALIALYRPGPMDMDSHNNYAKRKNGLQKIEPIHPELEEPLKQVLDETYGLIVYQEQVQSAARILAGYSLGKADVLRRAMGKKKPEVLAKEKIPFFAGMKEHGYSEEAAQAVWDVLVPFSGYAFNKAHSAAYGLISYWTAYLKTHYPVEFMAALLQGAANNKDKTALYLGEARRMGIKVLPPDVNESVLKYSAVGEIVRFGLGAIRNVGEKAVEEIIAERESSRGRYVNFADYIKRVPLVALNRRLVESLIKAGAFDSIDPNRRALFTIHESAIEQMVPLKRKEAEGQFDLFAGLGDDEEDSDSALGDAGIVVPDVEEWDKKTKLNFEREMLGLYVSDHPLSGMASVLAGLRDMSIAQLIERAKNLPDREQVTIAGLITNIERRVSKKGNPWALVTVEDLDSSIQCMFFGKAYEGAAAEMALDTVVRIRGTVDLRDETVSLRATEMEVPTLEAEDERPLIIMLPQTAMDRVHVQSLGNILHQHPGYCEVRLAIMDVKGAVTMLTLGDGFRVKRDASLFGEIKATFGPASLPVA